MDQGLVIPWGPDNQKTKHFFCKSRELDASASSTSQHQPKQAFWVPQLPGFAKKLKSFVFWLSEPHGTSNFDHQSLIHSDLNYTTVDVWFCITFLQIQDLMLSKCSVHNLNNFRKSRPHCTLCQVVAACSKLDLVFIVNAALWFSCS